MTDELPAGRELDAAVARAMGMNVQKAPGDDTYWTSSRDWTEPGDYYIEDGSHVHLLPNYSAPRFAEDQAALFGVVIWLAKHWTCDITIDAMGVSIADATTTIVLVPGDDQSALGLALCRAVVKVGS